jgi:hypothetical protein
MSGHEVPRLDITICVDPPNDNKDQVLPSTSPLDWPAGQYSPNGQQPYFEAYPQMSTPQDIPRINTSYENPNSSPIGMWDTRSPASSDSGLSNPSSPLVDQFGGDDFHDDGSDFLSDNRSYASDFQYQQEEFDIETYLSLDPLNVVQSPDTTSPGYLSGPDPYPMSPLLPNPNPLPSQSLQYTSPYSPTQGSPTFDLGLPGSYPNMGNNSQNSPTMRPTHQRSTSDFLSVPPSPTMIRGARSHSRGPGGHHRSTISEGSNVFLNTIIVKPEGSICLGDDLRGRGLSRAKSAPSSKAISRGKSPYERPASHADIAPRLQIPSFNGATTPELESPSPSSAKDVVATAAMVQASERRRKREATYFCPQCSASFTTENSRKRHESSHSGEKPYICTKDGCGQTFSNDDDRKRHENKSKKHAQ